MIPILQGAPKPSVPTLQAVGTGTPPAPKPGRKRGPSLRIGKVLHFFDFLPAWTLVDAYGVVAPCCGKCFQKLGDDPFQGKRGRMIPGAAPGAICVFCGKRAEPW